MKKNLWITCLLVIGAAACGFFIGKNNAETKAKAESAALQESFNTDLEAYKAAETTYKAEIGAYEAERDLNIQLNRSELEGLGEISGPIYVTGHKSPDSDTVCSAVAYAALLQKLGYDAHPAVLGSVNNETLFILEKAGVEVPALLEDASGLNMVLVDHSEYIQSAEGMKDANVITIIDHHGDGNVNTANRLIYDARPIGSTAAIIWMRYRNYGVEIDKSTAELLFGAILSDTSNFKSTTTTFADREAVKFLGEIAEISDTDAYYQELYKASLSYARKTDEEILFSDYKEYESGGKKFSIGVVQAYDDKTARDLAERMKAVLPAAQASTGVDLAMAQIAIFHDGLSVTYLVPSDEYTDEVIRAAFGDTAVFDGTSYVITPGFSRRQVLVPAISDVLAAHPGE